MDVVTQIPITAEHVGIAFGQQYYKIMHQSPERGHQFYQEISKLGRPEENGSMSITTTLKAINEKILSLNYGEFSTVIKTVDAQSSYSGGVHVLVTGYVTGKGNAVRNFIQSFFLAPQNSGYFVLNDMLRYVDDAAVNPPLVKDAVVPTAGELVSPPIEETKVSEQNTPSAEEAAAENGDVKMVVEVPKSEVVNKVSGAAPIVEEFSGKIEEVPKKSYASIVMHINKSAATVPPPPRGPQRASPKHVEKVIQATTPDPNGPISSSEPVDNGNNPEGEAEGHSIYIKGLPMNATEAMLEEVFKKFGDIKPNGIQVRSNRLQGFCFGFVEFADAASVPKVLEASPAAIGGRQCVCEEKRSTNTRGSNNRGRYPPGLRNEVGRGGNFGGARRGFNSNREEFYGRSNFNNTNNYSNNNRGNGRGNFDSNNRGGANRGRSDNSYNSNGGRMVASHRNGPMPNGSSATSKNNYAT